MSLAILFYFLCTQHVSDINIAIIRSLRLCCWITTSVVLFSVCCVLEIWRGWVWVVSVLQAEACNTDTTQTQPYQISNTQWSLQHWHYSNPSVPNLQHTTKPATLTLLKPSRTKSPTHNEACNTDTTQTQPYQISNTQRTCNTDTTQNQPYQISNTQRTRTKRPMW